MSQSRAQRIRALGMVSYPLDRNHAEFGMKLARAVSEIKVEAAGKTCGGCRHFRGDWCDSVTDADGQALEIGYPGAVACREWSAAKL